MGYPRPATLHRLVSKPDKLRAEKAEHLRQLVLSMDLPEGPVRQIVAAIDRATAAANGWTFLMVSPDANAAVVTYLFEHAARPKVSVRLWATIFTRLRYDTGEIVATQAELAAEIGVTRQAVNAALNELVGLNALMKWKAGREVRYGINPNVGTQLGGRARDEAQRAAGPLRLVL